MTEVGSRTSRLSPPCGLDQSARVAVVGLGKTGVSALRFLCRRGIACLAMDTRDQPPGLSVAQALGVPVFAGGLRCDWLSWATHLLVSPGIELDREEIRAALERGAALVSDIDLFAAETQAPVVGVTGSNGKSTVTTLVAEMAQAAGFKAIAGGNLGTPALDLLAETYELYVLELSSFQLERTRCLKLEAGAVLNISPDHLDRHLDLSSYAEIKARLLKSSRVKVINGDDPVVERLASGPFRQSGSWIRFSLVDAHADYGLIRHQGQEWLARRGERILQASEIRLVGRHNLANVLAALALAEAVGVPQDAALSVLPQFAGLPHRMQKVAEIGGVVWINDSKGTNVGATIAAIAGLEGPVVLLAGGDGKGADFSLLKSAVAGKVKATVLYGRDRGLLAQALDGVTEIRVVEDLPQAVAVARKIARPGDTVLLSPACASFDQFENYQARGECFTQEVLKWQ